MKENRQENARVLYVIKDKHGNVLSAPKEDDNVLWDRVDSMDPYNIRGLHVVVYTEKWSLKYDLW